MLTRRALLKVSSVSACLIGVNPAFALGPVQGPRRMITVDPFGDIKANATVWLDSGAHRICIWSACAGPSPSVAPGVRQLLSGTIEVEVDGKTVVRASTRAWAAGHRVALPGSKAGVWIQTQGLSNAPTV
ncbi:MAG: hypothetical protein ACI9U2_001304 [Bradymonadia bacterium]|jgi:hypothetical protein